MIRRYLSTTIIKLKIILNSIRREKLKKEYIIIGVAVAFTEKETNSDGNTGQMRRRHLQTGTQRQHQSENEWRVGCGKKCVIGWEIARVPSCHESSASDESQQPLRRGSLLLITCVLTNSWTKVIQFACENAVESQWKYSKTKTHGDPSHQATNTPVHRNILVCLIFSCLLANCRITVVTDTKLMSNYFFCSSSTFENLLVQSWTHNT